MECWKTVNGFEDYAVSNYGNVKNVRTNKLLKPDIKPNGYANVHLRKVGKTHHLYVHRLVANAFVVNGNSKKYVNHIDGNKQNNISTNLEWVTSSENIRHAVKTGLISCEGMHISQYDIDGNYIRSYKSIAEASRTLGICARGIWRCIHNERKTSGGYRWERQRA